MIQGSSKPSPDALPRGATIGRYVIVDLLGRGGMGVVYSAYDSQLDRKVAIKLLRPDVRGADASEIEARLLREAQALARLTHPNVVAVHDVGTHGHLVFIAMDFVEGSTLKEWLKTPRPLRERLRVLRDAGKGLAAAHAAGLVHRDVKPENLLVGTGGRVVVLDFGLARAQGDASREGPPPSSSGPHEVTGRTSDPLGSPLTLSGTVLGTVGYMAPEQAFGQAASAATDQFGYAATLYIALYGEKPFPEKDLSAYLTQTERPVPEPKKKAGVPPWLRRVVLRGLSRDPRKRFPSMDAMLEALANDPWVVRRRIALLAVMVLALTLGLAATSTAIRQRQQVCAADPAELAGVWDEDVRAAMTQAFERSGGEGARERASRVAKRLDDFAIRWSDMRADACLATKVRKKQPEDVLRLRNDCLDRERTQIRSLTTMLAHADSQVVKKAIEVAYGLPDVAWCADVAALRASAGLPDDPAARAKVLKVRAKLADVEAADLAGQAKEAAAGAEEAVTLARAIDDAATTADALLASGRQLQRLGDYQGALSPLREASLLATGAGADSIVVVAARTLAFVAGAKLQRTDEARIWLDIARAALKRIGGNETLELGILASEASILEEGESRPEPAVPIRERIVAADKRIYGPHPFTIVALYNLGDALCNVGEPARARPHVEEGVAMAELVGGPSYMYVAGSAYILGQVLVDQGEADEGDAYLARALAVFEQNGMDYWSALVVERLAASALARGRADLASERGERALDLLLRAKRPSQLVPIVSVTAALTRLRARPKDALPLCEQARLEQERVKAIDPDKVYGWDALRCEGEALLALGRGEEAIAPLERSLTIKRRMFRGDYARAQFALARALREAKREPERAMKLAKAAREDLATSPSLPFELHEVEAWIAKGGKSD